MSDDKKPIPVRPGESTSSSPPPSGSLANMLKGGANAVSSAIMASGHDNWNRALQVRSGSDADAALAAARQSLRPAPDSRVRAAVSNKVAFHRGDTVYDEVYHCRATITEIHASQTKKTKTPAHRLVGKGGSTWLQREDKLKKL